jgi:3-oxoacyl-[acyl-carrier protein] reductase
VSDPEAADRLVTQAAAELGSLDILVNNAGITRDGLLVRMSDADWADVLATNLTGAFSVTRSAARVMMKARWGASSTRPR